MKLKNRIKFVLSLGLSVLFATQAYAGEWSKEEDLKQEISYLAKKLLDMSGKDSYTVESPAVTKPFIGICADITEKGIAITCVTPGTQAEISGLKTGDVVTEMNKVSMVNRDHKELEKAYYGIVKNMKTKDVIAMTLNRAGETKSLEVTVGAVSHPAYVLKISKK